MTSAATAGRTAKADAMAFLQAALDGKAVPAAELSRAAHEHGLTAKAIRSAREALAVEIARDGFGPGGRWLWSLPAKAGTGEHIDAQPIPSSEQAGSGEEGGASWEGPNLSATHQGETKGPDPSENCQPKTIEGYEVIGLAPDEPCTYCGECCDDPVYHMQALFKGVGREPLHEHCAAHWFEWCSAINKRGGQGQD